MKAIITTVIKSWTMNSGKRICLWALDAPSLTEEIVWPLDASVFVSFV